VAIDHFLQLDRLRDASCFHLFLSR
jgi:hypothetical protein